MNAKTIAEQFSIPFQIGGVYPYGSGYINSTYRVETEHPEKHFILQKINPFVFPDPKQIMANLAVLNRHFFTSAERPFLAEKPYQMPELIYTQSGAPYLEAEEETWRMLSFIPHTYAVEQMKTHHQAEEVGRVLGLFHKWTAKLDITLLSDTLPGFHITPAYLSQYKALPKEQNSRFDSIQSQEISAFIKRYHHRAPILENALQKGDLPLQVMHGDPKISNILFDRRDHQGVAIIDLDTVKPGLIHYDIGDCLRSCCNLLGEETNHFDQVEFNLSFCEKILQSYIAYAGSTLSPNSFSYLYDATFLMIYELGIRFFTDYLQGDLYFKTNHKQHNLNRAYTQMKLAQSLERQKGAFQNVVESLSQGAI